MAVAERARGSGGGRVWVRLRERRTGYGVLATVELRRRVGGRVYKVDVPGWTGAPVAWYRALPEKFKRPYEATWEEFLCWLRGAGLRALRGPWGAKLLKAVEKLSRPTPELLAVKRVGGEARVAAHCMYEEEVPGYIYSALKRAWKSGEGGRVRVQNRESEVRVARTSSGKVLVMMGDWGEWDSALSLPPLERWSGELPDADWESATLWATVIESLLRSGLAPQWASRELRAYALLLPLASRAGLGAVPEAARWWEGRVEVPVYAEHGDVRMGAGPEGLAVADGELLCCLRLEPPGPSLGCAPAGEWWRGVELKRVDSGAAREAVELLPEALRSPEAAKMLLALLAMLSAV